MTRPFVIPKRLVWEAFQRVKANGGSAGVDQESIETFERKLGDNLYKLRSRMESGSYFPPPVKAVPIPKKSGGTRILGVPTVADRAAQTVRWMCGCDDIFRAYGSAAAACCGSTNVPRHEFGIGVFAQYGTSSAQLLCTRLTRRRLTRDELFGPIVTAFVYPRIGSTRSCD
jgi:hypothetical protein